jgi:hypothetical protein
VTCWFGREKKIVANTADRMADVEDATGAPTAGEIARAQRLLNELALDDHKSGRRGVRDLMDPNADAVIAMIVARQVSQQIQDIKVRQTRLNELFEGYQHVVAIQRWCALSRRMPLPKVYVEVLNAVQQDVELDTLLAISDVEDRETVTWDPVTQRHQRTVTIPEGGIPRPASVPVLTPRQLKLPL